MASRQRYRSGPSAPVKAKIQGGTGLVFEIGDLVYLPQNANYILPASQIANSGTDTFQDQFYGVLKQGATTGDEVDDVDALVEPCGDHEYDLPSASTIQYPAGKMVGASSSGGYLLDQTVEVLDDAEYDLCIGHLAKPVEVGDTTAVVRIRSTRFNGGISAP